jgi:hypothetical protein
MPLMFNTILEVNGFQLTDVRLLRHKDTGAEKGRSPYELWRDDRKNFELYQSTQSLRNRTRLTSSYWAVFLGTPNNETMFVGIYLVKYLELLKEDIPSPHMDGLEKAGTRDVYELILEERLHEYIGRLLIEWGPGKLAWIQRADQQNKKITELRKEFKEPEFPGFLNFIMPLSKLNKIPVSWKSVLQSSKGIYLITCPKTREQYVGSATGTEGFWQRWQDYVQTVHGGNLGLKSRDPSDYQVSILEVAGTALTDRDILKMEELWKLKLQSREMGLNR